VFLLELVLAPTPPRKGDLEPRHRRPLLKQRLIELEKHGRTELIIPTDAAWDWVGANLGMALSRTQPRRALSAVLARLRDFLAAREIAFADFVQPAPREQPQPHRPQPHKPQARTQRPAHTQRSARKQPPRKQPPRKQPPRKQPPLERRIRDAYVAHTKGMFHTRMRLTVLRAMLADAERPVLDAELRQLSARGALALFPLDDRTEISAADSQDALDLSGVPQHVMYLEG
jgi:hypothetical protein